MRILIASDIPVTYACGSTYFIKRLGARLVRNGHQLLVLCPSSSRRNERYTAPEGFDVAGLPSLPSVVQKTLRLTPPFALRGKISRIVADFRPDAIHVQTHFLFIPTLLRVARQMGIPTIGTNHFMPENIFYHFHLPWFCQRALIWIGWKHLHRIFRGLAAVTTPTETAAKFMRASGFPQDVQAISNGIDLKHFFPGQGDDSLYKKYAFRRKPTLLYVGRLDPEKNIDVAVRALAIIRNSVDAQLVIVGLGTKENALRKLVRELHLADAVIFTGFISDADLPKLYCLADIFIMPGDAELQSIATMEAMASGLPIVAANAMALPELVKSEINGLLFTNKNAAELAAATLHILQDPQKKKAMGAASPTLAAAQDISATVAAFERLYVSVAK